MGHLRYWDGFEGYERTWSSCEEGALRLLDDKADLESATQWNGILQEVTIQEIAHLQETLREATQQKCRWVGWSRGATSTRVSGSWGYRYRDFNINNGYGHFLSTYLFVTSPYSYRSTLSVPLNFLNRRYLGGGGVQLSFPSWSSRGHFYTMGSKEWCSSATSLVKSEIIKQGFPWRSSHKRRRRGKDVSWYLKQRISDVFRCSRLWWVAELMKV